MRKLLLAALLLSATASAHTAVTAVTPAAFATVSAPRAVQLSFSEPIDLHFATVKVYPLKVTGDHPALNRAAETLLKTALGAKDDAAQRADTAPKLSGMGAKLSLPLKPGLKPGNYAVLWRILSDDGHVVTGQSVFSVK